MLYRFIFLLILSQWAFSPLAYPTATLEATTESAQKRPSGPNYALMNKMDEVCKNPPKASGSLEKLKEIEAYAPWKHYCRLRNSYATLLNVYLQEADFEAMNHCDDFVSCLDRITQAKSLLDSEKIEYYRSKLLKLQRELVDRVSSRAVELIMNFKSVEQKIFFYKIRNCKELFARLQELDNGSGSLEFLPETLDRQAKEYEKAYNELVAKLNVHATTDNVHSTIDKVYILLKGSSKEMKESIFRKLLIQLGS